MSSSEPATPRQVRSEKSKIVELQDAQGKTMKVVQVTDKMGNTMYYPLENPEAEPQKKRPGAKDRVPPRWRRMTRGVIWRRAQVERWLGLMVKIFTRCAACDQTWKQDSRGRLIPVMLQPRSYVQVEKSSIHVPYPTLFQPEARMQPSPAPLATFPSMASLASSSAAPARRSIGPADVRALKTSTERAKMRRQYEEFVLQMSVAYFHEMTPPEIEDCLKELTIEGGLSPLARQLGLPHRGRKPELMEAISSRIQAMDPPPRPKGAAVKKNSKQLPRGIPMSSSTHRVSSIERVCGHNTCLLNRDIAIGDVITDDPDVGVCHHICGQALRQIHELAASGTSTASQRPAPRR